MKKRRRLRFYARQKDYEAALQRLQRRLAGRPDVLGVGIGQYHRKGSYLASVSLVVRVTRKLLPAELRRENIEPIPPFVRAGGKRIPVDVQHSCGEKVGTLQGLVASEIDDGGALAGAVGAIVDYQGSRRVLTAGHVARAPGRVLSLRDAGDATVRALWQSDRLDHAVLDLRGQMPPDGPQLRNGLALNGMAATSGSIIGTDAFCHDVTSGERIATTVRNYPDSAPFDFGGSLGVVQMYGLVSAQRCTVGGDSGTLLYTADNDAIGTLLGVLGDLSYFIPCDDAFSTIGLELVT